MNNNNRDKEINLLKELIDNSKNKKIKMLSKIELKVNELKYFDSSIVEKLLTIKTNILPREYGGYNIPPSKLGIEGPIIKYSEDGKSLSFNLSIIEKYLKKIEK